MRQEIDNVFRDIEEQPLFYIESGSRLWGIASPDSDYDVRGFHLQSKRQYFDFQTHRDILEVMDGDFDFVSYDIDKMFGLLVKSNPTVFEWIRANIVYFNALPEWNTFQHNVIANFDFKALFHHYLSLANGHIDVMKLEAAFTYKAAFYCIRGLLSAELASRNIVPELLIDNLFNQFDRQNDLIQIAQNSLERKKQKGEKEEVVASERELIVSAIKHFRGQLEGKAPASSNNKASLEAILTDYSIHVKELHYGV